MAIEERADDSAGQHSGKRLVMRLWLPFGDDLIAFGKLRIRNPFSLNGPQPKQMLDAPYCSCSDFGEDMGWKAMLFAKRGV